MKKFSLKKFLEEILPEWGRYGSVMRDKYMDNYYLAEKEVENEEDKI